MPRHLIPFALTLLCAAPLSGMAQDGDRQFLSAMLEPAPRKQATYYKVSAGVVGELFKGRIYTMEGRLKAEGTWLDEALTVEHGEFVFYHGNSKVESRGRYEHGAKSGVWQRFDTAGRPLAEKVYDPEPLANIIYTRAQSMPRSAKGDERELVKYLREQAGTLDGKRVKGSLVTTFVVEKDGSLSDVNVIEPTGRAEQATAGVLRALERTTPWEPGREKGQPVRTRVRLPITF